MTISNLGTDLHTEFEEALAEARDLACDLANYHYERGELSVSSNFSNQATLLDMMIAEFK